DGSTGGGPDRGGRPDGGEGTARRDARAPARRPTVGAEPGRGGSSRAGAPRGRRRTPRRRSRRAPAGAGAFRDRQPGRSRPPRSCRGGADTPRGPGERNRGGGVHLQRRGPRGGFASPRAASAPAGGGRPDARNGPLRRGPFRRGRAASRASPAVAGHGGGPR